jgi:BirA family biotin operon repressor/biotin-[acetyl-CoA-carboxylase] ligase
LRFFLRSRLSEQGPALGWHALLGRGACEISSFQTTRPRMRARKKYTIWTRQRPEFRRSYNAKMLEVEFAKAVAGLPFKKAAYFSSIGSTNDVVATWAAEGATGLCLAYADEQTSGRGRAGRSWFTPPGSALAFSVLLENPQELEPNILGLVSGLGALAVCEAIERLYHLKPQIKWPNDMLLNGKKACGVLAEAQWSGEQLKALVLGIGINVAPQSVPTQNTLSFPATSIEDALGENVEPADLMRGILVSLIDWKDRLRETNFVETWQARLAYKGQRVNLEGGGEFVEGEVLGLAPDGRLRMRINDSEREFSLGEIQIHR